MRRGEDEQNGQEVERTVKTFAYMDKSARFFLSKAQETEEGSFYNAMSAIVFAAFCIEAYLNHIGDQQMAFWRHLKRPLGPRDKLHVVCSNHDIEVDFGRSPFQSFTETFRLRNLVAHGETETVAGNDGPQMEMLSLPLPLTEWEAMATPEKARRIVEDAARLVRHIHTGAGLDGDPFNILSSGIAR